MKTIKITEFNQFNQHCFKALKMLCSAAKLKKPRIIDRGNPNNRTADDLSKWQNALTLDGKANNFYHITSEFSGGTGQS